MFEWIWSPKTRKGLIPVATILTTVFIVFTFLATVHPILAGFGAVAFSVFMVRAHDGYDHQNDA